MKNKTTDRTGTEVGRESHNTDEEDVTEVGRESHKLTTRERNGGRESNVPRR
jgi:hypothetical protein